MSVAAIFGDNNQPRLPSQAFLSVAAVFYGLDQLRSFPEIATKLFAELKNQKSNTQISGLIPGNFSQIAPHLKDVFSTIEGVFFLTMGIKSTINLVRHLFPQIPNPFSNSIPIDIDQALLNIDRVLDQKIAGWTTILEQLAVGKYQGLKDEVVLQCKGLTDLLRAIRSQSMIGVPEVQLASLRRLMGKLDPVLVELASMNLSEKDFEQNKDNNLPFMKLSFLGFRDLNWTSVARQIGWDSEDSIFLPLKLVEKGIFSINDLRGKKILDPKYPSTDEQVSALIQVLNGQDVSHQSDPRWEVLMKVVHMIDRVIARIFALAFHSLVFLTGLYAGFDCSGLQLLQVVLQAVDAGWLGFHKRLSASMFVEGDAMSRLTWMVAACFPVYPLVNSTVYALTYHGYKSVPRILYQTYFS
jgi:hypothetical protein